MPGRTGTAAQEAFLEPLRRCLSCVTDAQLFVAPSGQPVEAISLSENPLTLHSAVIPSGLRLQLRQQYRVVTDNAAPVAERCHVSTVAYFYRLTRGNGGELVSWHWHPGTGIAYPHTHINADPISRRMHLPSGRVSIESVLRLLLLELGVPPKREDWRTVIDEAESRFLEHRRW